VLLFDPSLEKENSRPMRLKTGGIALLSVMLVIVILTLLAVSIVGFSTMQGRYSLKRGMEITSKQAALAGFSEAESILAKTRDWSDSDTLVTAVPTPSGGAEHEAFVVTGPGCVYEKRLEGSDCYYSVDLKINMNDPSTADVVTSGYFKGPGNRIEWKRTIAARITRGIPGPGGICATNENPGTPPVFTNADFSGLVDELKSLESTEILPWNIGLKNFQIKGGDLATKQKGGVLIAKNVSSLDNDGRPLNKLTIKASMDSTFAVRCTSEYEVVRVSMPRTELIDFALSSTSNPDIQGTNVPLDPGDYDTLKIGAKSSVMLKGGNYHVKSLILGDASHRGEDGAAILVDSRSTDHAHPVKLYIQSSLIASPGSVINGKRENLENAPLFGDAGVFELYGKKDTKFMFMSSAGFAGHIKGQADIGMRNTTVEGSITGNSLSAAGGSLTVKSGAITGPGSISIISWEER
jgi:hypothetical protein